jgi:hypothetical protein
MALGIAHAEPASDGRTIAILDRVLEVKPPFSPHTVATMFADEIKRYGAQQVTGDAFAKGWVAEAFTAAGVAYLPSAWTRSDLYLRFLAKLNSEAVRLLDDARLVQQLAALERKVGTAGRDAVDHVRGAHDDLANAACGAVALASEPATPLVIACSSIPPTADTYHVRPAAGPPIWAGLRGGVTRPPDAAARDAHWRTHDLRGRPTAPRPTCGRCGELIPVPRRSAKCALCGESFP